MKNKIKLALQSLMKHTKGVYNEGGMNNRERELRQAVSDLKEEAQALMDENKQKEARAKLDDAKAKKSELDNFLALQKDFQGITLPDVDNKGAQMQPEPKKDEAKEYKGLFFKAIRGQSLTEDELSVMERYKARLTSERGEDGGYVIPEDIQTQINKLRQTTDDLKQYVNVVPVSTNKGARTLEKRADQVPFSPLSEYGDPNAMEEIDSPQFDRVPYNIEDYAGFLPVYNSILDDSDQALEQYLIEWIAKKGKATDNFYILEVIDGFEKIEKEDYTGIKDVLNVELEPAFANEAVIYTNQDGFNYLDKLEDNNGRPLLQPDPTQATRKLFAGTHPIIPLSNKTIKSVGTKVPFIIGVLDEAVNYWDREQLSIDMTKVGGQAWRSNTTEFRAIMRLDTGAWDNEAVKYIQIDTNQGENDGGVEG